MSCVVRKAMTSAGLFVLLFAAHSAAQQTNPQRDTLRPLPLDAVIVTAERTAATLGNSIGAVSALSSGLLARRPVRTLAEAIQQAPGIVFVDFEGTGADPQLLTRGFYGGGEADYALLLLDGRPINNAESGRINWDLVPLSAVQSIEVVRGPVSVAWGDAAMGGVINVITRRPSTPSWNASLAGGENGVWRAAANGSGVVSGRNASVLGNVARSAGYREHAERTTGGLNASMALAGTPERGISLSTFHDWRQYDEPGPLTGTELAADRTQSSPFYRFDESSERVHQLALDAHSSLAGGDPFNASLSAEYRSSDRVRTLQLAPVFADTKNRVFSSTRVQASASTEHDGALFSTGNLLLGIDASYTRISSSYYDFLQGDAANYRGANASRGELSSQADGNRLAGAAFLRTAVQLTDALRFTLGGRFDWLRDSFEPDSGATLTTDHGVPSARAGINFRYAQQGHVYASVGTSFKAPTPDQLYDQRKVPVPVPPFAITFSNFDLEPQRGTNFEAGVYHTAALIANKLDADLSLSVYQMDLEDELDFDVLSLSYGNIGESRHRGVEAGLTLRGPSLLSGFANYTLQSATARSDENAGKYLKAIPRQFIVSGITAGRNTGVSGSLVVMHAQDMPLDDANTRKLPDWTRWDARLAYTFRDFRITADLLNLANAHYSTTGFPDPAGGDDVYYYPAAGRTLHIGLSWR